MKRPSVGHLWIAGGLSMALLIVLTVLGATASDRSVARFLVYAGGAAVLMILAGKGHGWARWLVSALLVFFAVTTLAAGGWIGWLLAAVFGASATVFFTYRGPHAPSANA